MLKIAFISVSFILVVLLTIYKLFIKKLKQNPKISVYVSFMAGFLLFYVLNAILLSIFAQTFYDRFLYIYLGLIPFIIGKLATYEKENYYSWIQIVVIGLGIISTIFMEF